MPTTTLSGPQTSVTYWTLAESLDLADSAAALDAAQAALPADTLIADVVSFSDRWAATCVTFLLDGPTGRHRLTFRPDYVSGVPGAVTRAWDPDAPLAAPDLSGEQVDMLLGDQAVTLLARAAVAIRDTLLTKEAAGMRLPRPDGATLMEDLSGAVRSAYRFATDPDAWDEAA